MKHRICQLLLPLLLMLILNPASAAAVIFSSDTLYLFAKGVRISNSSVIVQYHSDPGQKLKLCENGILRLRQGPTWSAGPHHLYITAAADNLNWQGWLKSELSQKCSNSDCYQQYLARQISPLRPTVTITIPTLQEKPPIIPDKKKQPENRIGHDRYFRVELETGQLTQLPGRL